MPRIPFATNSYQSRARAVSLQRLVNLFPEIQPADAKSRLVLHGTPGMTLFADCGGTTAVRAMKAFNGALYAIVADTVFKVSSAGVVTSLGTIEHGDFVTMDQNGVQLVITSTPAAYVVTTSDVLTKITDPDFPGASSVAVLDGYAIFSTPDSGQWFLSDILDASAIDALDFATAESAPDDLVRVLVDHREAWLFGTETIEIWYNAGGADFPFSRVSGAHIERGCAAAGSIASADNSVFWLGDDLIIYRAQGYQGQRISTHAIEGAIAKYAIVSDATSLTYTQAGHTFYAITFPTAGATWVYDAATQLWHERESLGMNRWRAECAEAAFGFQLVGDAFSGKIYKLDLDVYTEAGETIRRVAMSPPVHADGNRVAQHDLEIEFEAGVGLTLGQGSDPQAMLRWTDDDGTTWSDEKWTTIGKLGKRRNRAIWRRLGTYRNRTYELSISDPVKVALIAAEPYMARPNAS